MLQRDGAFDNAYAQLRERERGAACCCLMARGDVGWASWGLGPFRYPPENGTYLRFCMPPSQTTGYGFPTLVPTHRVTEWKLRIGAAARERRIGAGKRPRRHKAHAVP